PPLRPAVRFRPALRAATAVPATPGGRRSSVRAVEAVSAQPPAVPATGANGPPVRLRRRAVPGSSPGGSLLVRRGTSTAVRGGASPGPAGRRRRRLRVSPDSRPREGGAAFSLRDRG